MHINTLREQLFIEDFLTQELEKLGKNIDSDQKNSSSFTEGGKSVTHYARESIRVLENPIDLLDLTTGNCDSDVTCISKMAL